MCVLLFVLGCYLESVSWDYPPRTVPIAYSYRVYSSEYSSPESPGTNTYILHGWTAHQSPGCVTHRSLQPSAAVLFCSTGYKNNDANKQTDGLTDRQTGRPAEVRRESETVSKIDGRESETFKQMVGQARWKDR